RAGRSPADSRARWSLSPSRPPCRTGGRAWERRGNGSRSACSGFPSSQYSLGCAGFSRDSPSACTAEEYALFCPGRWGRRKSRRLRPRLQGKPLTADHYRDLLEDFTGDPLQHLARLAWRALIDDDEKLRDYALAAIDLGVEALDAPARTQKPRKPQLSSDVQELRKKTEEALKDADRSAKERDSMRDQLAQARSEISAREKTLADVRDELGQVRGE